MLNGLLFFTAIDAAAGEELWATDGTEAGTVPMADIKPGPFDAEPSDLTAVGGVLFFTAFDDVSGE
ncbi:MAG: ELWxxDGT repeat protein, partial [Candidatus Rokuibacteriota bacterium]